MIQAWTSILCRFVSGLISIIFVTFWLLIRLSFFFFFFSLREHCLGYGAACFTITNTKKACQITWDATSVAAMWATKDGQLLTEKQTALSENEVRAVNCTLSYCGRFNHKVQMLLILNKARINCSISIRDLTINRPQTHNETFKQINIIAYWFILVFFFLQWFLSLRLVLKYAFFWDQIRTGQRDAFAADTFAN